jgi:hypothetical protein
MNSKQFLIIGGIILVVVGILGMVGAIGPTPAQSWFGSSWYFDQGENWAHLILGIVALIAAFTLGASAQKSLVILVGILGLFFAVWNIFSTSFLGANLESPADLILHAVIGIWALYAAMNKRSGGASMMSSM